MSEVVLRMVAGAITACLLCFFTVKMLGAMQQSGYKTGNFFRWLTRKDNLQFNRLAVLSLCLTLVSAVTPLCFSFLGERAALLIAVIPFFGLLFAYGYADSKFALKVPLKRTGRAMRLLAVYWLFTACAAYLLIAAFAAFSALSDSFLYGLLQYAPVGILPALLPFLLIGANAFTSIFEELRNKRFIKWAGLTLERSGVIRIGIVGSYGKTSVKNILKTMLSEKYSVIATPESYNTPIGIAKTVLSNECEGKQIFIAEMGARKKGDIAELCALVKPDYALFTGICEQHIQSFGSLENVWAEKSEIVKCGAKKVVCGGSLKERLEVEFAGEESIIIEDGVGEVHLGAIATAFELNLYGEKIQVKTKLLGKAAVENIRLAAKLCQELGLTAEEIVRGIEKIEPIPHRLQLLEQNGVYILDDGYNCNPKSAQEAIKALQRFGGRQCIVTPGIVECGVLEEAINQELGASIAKANFDKVIFVGETLIGAVKSGYESANGDMQKCVSVKTLDSAKEELSTWLQEGDAVLFLNDLPDVY